MMRPAASVPTQQDIMTHHVMMVDPPLLPKVPLSKMDLIMVYAVGAASNITPDAVITVKLDDDRIVYLDSMLYATDVFAAAQDIWLNRVPLGSPIAEGGGICVVSSITMSSKQALILSVMALPLHTQSV